jgi:hypothetical protein
MRGSQPQKALKESSNPSVPSVSTNNGLTRTKKGHKQNSLRQLGKQNQQPQMV